MGCLPELGLFGIFQTISPLRSSMVWPDQGEKAAMLKWTLWEQAAQDLRYSLRTMAASPGFTAMAALSLALGIGANTAIYTFMDAILMRSLPVQNPEALALVQYSTKDFPAIAHGFSGSNFRDSHLGMVSGNIPFPAYEALRGGNRVFDSLFGFSNVGNLTMLVH